MRTLVVSSVMPSPEISGTAIRTGAAIRALSRMGDVDLCCILGPEGERDYLTRGGSRRVVADLQVARQVVLARPGDTSRGLARSRWLLSSRLPIKVGARDYSEVRERFAEWKRDYDLAWLARAESWVALADLLDCPIVCDLDDLEDRKIVGARTLEAQPVGARSWLRRRASALLNRADVKRWERLHASIASRAARVVLCSDLDRERARVPNTAVVPNCYPAPSRPAGSADVSRPPTVMFVGLLTYAPNADAVAFLVRDVFPVLRGFRPDVEIRLVGRHDGLAETLGPPSGVRFVGQVEDVAAELAGADVIVVPLRFGSGTRVKVLEAFAHRIPVVATPLGAEGLGARDGVHLLLGHDADELARACDRVLGDADLRDRLVASAHELWYSRFRPQHGEEAVRAVARQALASHPIVRT